MGRGGRGSGLMAKKRGIVVTEGKGRVLRTGKSERVRGVGGRF